MNFPWFPMHAQELLSDSNFSSWDIEERGAWLTLIAYCWKDGSIPSDQTSLAKLLHCQSNAMASLWSAIGSRFIADPGQPGRLISPRIEEERVRAEQAHKRRQDAGTKGGLAKASNAKAKPKRRYSNALATPTHIHRQVNTNSTVLDQRADSGEIVVDHAEWNRRRDAELDAKYGRHEP